MVAPAVTAFVSSVRTSAEFLPDLSLRFNTAVEFYFSTDLVGASIGVYLFGGNRREIFDKVFNLEEGKQLDCLMRHSELSFTGIGFAGGFVTAIVIINLDNNAVLYAQNVGGLPQPLMSDNVPEVNGIVPPLAFGIEYSPGVDIVFALGGGPVSTLEDFVWGVSSSIPVPDLMVQC